LVLAQVQKEAEGPLVLHNTATVIIMLYTIETQSLQPFKTNCGRSYINT